MEIKTHMMVMIHTDEKCQINYDLSTGQYWQFDKQNEDISKNDNRWLILQPIVIAGIETVNRFLTRYPTQIRIFLSFIVFILFAIAGSLVWEAVFSALLDKAKQRGRQIHSPDKETLKVWAQDIPRRLWNAALISATTMIIILTLGFIFAWTGIPLFMTLALATYLIGYFIVASARPVSQYRYWIKVSGE